MAILYYWGQDWIKVLKHAEMQSETRRVQSFGAKSGANALAGPQISTLKIKMKALIVFFRTR